MSILMVGSVALDDVRTPFGEVKDALGGSCSYASISASHFSDVAIVGVIGDDFPRRRLDLFRRHDIDLSGLQRIKGGRTFHWSGYYEHDMNQAHTLNTALNVFAEFRPAIPEKLRESEFVLLGNIDPDLQLEVLEQVRNPRLVLIDTMNFWISGKREQLLRVLRKSHIVLLNEAEARQLCDTVNLQVAAQRLLKLGLKRVIIKKGEHGCLMFSGDTYFAAPAFPLEMIKDPTGAGDTFAGGFIGYLASARSLNEMTFRKAVIAGTAMASFTVEEFSLKRLASLKSREIGERCDRLRNLSSFPKITIKSCQHGTH
ncbi:MAG: PfkB family carbohydrate kinase [Candidatus Sumerlaeota bacterium]|nr:PfkB family carbohydrate kinase [Candidatus Sumerlaeota bacterium]